MIIACDTSSMLCSVAVAHRGEVLFQKKVRGAQVHIEQLTPFLQEALDFAKTTGTHVDALALAIGPGSFNGLRIGLSTMKGLALTKQLPLIPIPSTDALALQFREHHQGKGRAIIYSHRNFVHTADYVLDPDVSIQTPTLHYGSWDQLDADDLDFYFGSPERAFKDWLEKDAPAHLQVNFHEITADAGHIAILAEGRSEAAADLDTLEPMYNAHYEAKKWVPPSF